MLWLLGCSGVIDLGSLDDPKEILDLCEQRTPEVLTLDVEFPASNENCPWGLADNLEPQNGMFTARSEQRVQLDVPEDAILCDLVLDFGGANPGDVRHIVYDDHFFFDFDDIVMASSISAAVQKLPAPGTLPTWDWASIVGMDYHAVDQEQTFCLGADAGDADCVIPGTEVEGELSLSWSADLVAQLSLSAIEQKRYEFAFVTTGDDDPATDCRHEDFSFSVEVPYLRGQ
jgi:hypothetical protein